MDNKWISSDDNNNNNSNDLRNSKEVFETIGWHCSFIDAYKYCSLWIESVCISMNLLQNDCLCDPLLVWKILCYGQYMQSKWRWINNNNNKYLTQYKSGDSFVEIKIRFIVEKRIFNSLEFVNFPMHLLIDFLYLVYHNKSNSYSILCLPNKNFKCIKYHFFFVLWKWSFRPLSCSLFFEYRLTILLYSITTFM